MIRAVKWEERQYPAPRLLLRPGFFNRVLWRNKRFAVRVAIFRALTSPRVDSELSGFRVILLGSALLFIVGCRHRNQAIAAPPPPPPSAAPAPAPTRTPEAQSPPQSGFPAAGAAIADSPADADFVRSHTPFSTEEGLASWYGPPYDKHPGANGRIYDQNALTAAHRTLPLNSLIQVTNLTTGQSVIVRVTDRGPFVSGRILDLSLASAKAIGVWRPGVARVRIDVFASPSPLDQGGRWCVQVGVFRDVKHAMELRDHLMGKYQTANVIEFAGPTGFWVRIRPLHDDKDRAFEIARDLKPSEGEAYLVRLD
jgi:rare lipoprotein A